MYPVKLLAFRWYIVLNVLAGSEGGLGSLSSRISFSPSLSPCILFPHPGPITCNEMLGDVDRRFHRIVSWRVALPVHDTFDVIAFHYMTQYVISDVFSQLISYILLFQLRVSYYVSSHSAFVSSPFVLLSSLATS